MDTFEIKRKSLHILAGTILITLIHFDYLDTLTLTGLTILALLLSNLSKKQRIPGIYWFLKQFDRPDDITKFPGKGAVYFIISSAILMFLFDKSTTIASLAILTFGDGIAPIVGIHFGKNKLNWSEKKSWEGQLVGGFAAFIAILILTYLNMTNVLIFNSIIVIILSMLLESLSNKSILKKLDDNLSVPIFAGFMFWLLRII